MRTILCKIVTLGMHWWTYGAYTKWSKKPKVYCRICYHIPGNQWEIYEKKFKGKKKGKVKV